MSAAAGAQCLPPRCVRSRSSGTAGLAACQQAPACCPSPAQQPDSSVLCVPGVLQALMGLAASLSAARCSHHRAHTLSPQSPSSDGVTRAHGGSLSCTSNPDQARTPSTPRRGSGLAAPTWEHPSAAWTPGHSTARRPPHPTVLALGSACVSARPRYPFGPPCCSR